MTRPCVWQKMASE